MKKKKEIKIFSGLSHPELGEHICRCLGFEPGKIDVGTFSDGETRVKINENVRGRDVFVVQSTSNPTNHHLMEALVIVDACRRASARTITMVVPYFGYARQERKDAPRSPITAKLVAELMEAAGVVRLLTLELHNPAIQGFFRVPVDHLFSRSVFLQCFQGELARPVVVSPDAGGVERTRAFAKRLGCQMAIIDKRRPAPNESAVMHIVGDVAGADCLILDDIVDTAGSLCNAAVALVDAGARSVRAGITHAVLSGNALARVAEAPIDELVVTDSIRLSETAKACGKIRQVSVAPLIADAIERIAEDRSISSLFA